MKKLITIIALTALSISQSLWANAPRVSDAKAMAQPPGASVTAGYLTLTNIAGDPLVITGASSDTIARVEMHESVVENDIASMKKHEAIQIGAGATLEFKHGGFHLMLMDLTEQLMPGSTVNITLHTNQGDVEIAMPVKMPSMNHDKMKGHDMKHDDIKAQEMLEPKVVH